MHNTFAFITRRQNQKFTGYLHFGAYMLYFDNGVLCTAETKDDRFWVLRRLLCGNHITDAYAQELQESEDDLALILFPTLPEKEWIRIWKDRSRQNLFTILGSGKKPMEVSCFVDKLPFLHNIQLQELVLLYKELYPLQSRIQHIWIKAKNSNSTVQANVIPLSSLVAQSPWEEVDILRTIHNLIKEGELDWGENIAALEGSILEEEASLFGNEEDQHRKNVQFVVPQRLLDKVQLGKDTPSPEDQ
jgi:hypothetical protein